MRKAHSLIGNECSGRSTQFEWHGHRRSTGRRAKRVVVCLFRRSACAGDAYHIRHTCL